MTDRTIRSLQVYFAEDENGFIGTSAFPGFGAFSGTGMTARCDKTTRRPHLAKLGQITSDLRKSCQASK
jgi:hypothetical protein